MASPSTLSPRGITTAQGHASSAVETNHSAAIFQGREYEILKSLPKCNAHCHLGGEIPLATLKKHANETQLQDLEKVIQGITQAPPQEKYKKAFGVFPFISIIINTHERLKEATRETCERFKEDHNQIVLMRTGLKELEGKQHEEYLKTVIKGIQEAAAGDFKVCLMLSLNRNSTFEMAKLTVDLALKYRESGVIGIDISDVSTRGNINVIMLHLLRAKSEGLKIAVHMGESPEEKDQMVIINSLQPDLIDHGVNLCEAAKLWVKQKKVPVTVCLTSSIATAMHKPEESHPWITEHNNSDHPIHLGTDDSAIFDVCLTGEFVKLCPDLGVEKVVKIANRSFKEMKDFLCIQ